MTKTNKALPIVAIVGRPNVGKSSLFNAIIGQRLSIVHEMSGVTRDRVVAPADWGGRQFELVDTGGIGVAPGARRNVDFWDERITEQAAAAIDDADVLIFVVNVQESITALDEEVADRLRVLDKPVILLANKADNPQLAAEAVEMTALGFGVPYAVSCLHRRGIGDMLDAVLMRLPPGEPEAAPEAEDAADDGKLLRIAVVGRPNVGKSSLVNALLGEERVLVSEEAGTTRDAIDVGFQLRYKETTLPCVLVDTAGLRKKAKVKDAVEMFSVMRSEKAIERARLVLFLVECSPEGMTAQDRKIASMIQQSGKACIIVANKFDTCREAKQKKLLEELRYTLPGMSYAPVVFVSAKEKYNLNKLLDQIAQLVEQLSVRISTSLVNRVLLEAFQQASPPVVGVAPLKIYYASMIGNEPPKFLLFVNEPKYCAPNYLTYLKNCLRQAFDFTGLPLMIELRARPKKVASFHTPVGPSGNKGKAKKRKRSDR